MPMFCRMMKNIWFLKHPYFIRVLPYSQNVTFIDCLFACNTFYNQFYRQHSRGVVVKLYTWLNSWCQRIRVLHIFALRDFSASFFHFLHLPFTPTFYTYYFIFFTLFTLVFPLFPLAFSTFSTYFFHF